jgi:hypothetical protein
MAVFAPADYALFTGDKFPQLVEHLLGLPDAYAARGEQLAQRRVRHEQRRR